MPMCMHQFLHVNIRGPVDGIKREVIQGHQRSRYLYSFFNYKSHLAIPSESCIVTLRFVIYRPTYGISGWCCVHAARTPSGLTWREMVVYHLGQTQILDYGQFGLFIKLEAYGIKQRFESLTPHII